MPTSRAAALVLALALPVGGALAGCSKDEGSSEAFCAQVKRMPALETVLARFDEADPDVLTDRVAKARTAYDALADAAPGDIDDETADVVALVDAILDAVLDHPTDPGAAADQLRKVVADHPDAERSRTKVAAYAQEECDVRLDPTLAPSSGTTTTAPDGATTTTEG